MRTLSVVTKLTVEARSRGESCTSGRPQRSTSPEATGPSPASARSSVLLPLPLRPSSAVRLPCAKVVETSSSSVRRP